MQKEWKHLLYRMEPNWTISSSHVLFLYNWINASYTPYVIVTTEPTSFTTIFECSFNLPLHLVDVDEIITRNHSCMYYLRTKATKIIKSKQKLNRCMYIEYCGTKNIYERPLPSISDPTKLKRQKVLVIKKRKRV